MNIPQLDFAFRVRIDFPVGARIRFPVRGGEMRGYVSVDGGTVTGPRLTGDVIPGSGGDWPVFRSDGVVAFDARYLIRTADGTIIQVFNRGYAHASADVQARIDFLPGHADVEVERQRVAGVVPRLFQRQRLRFACGHEDLPDGLIERSCV